MAVVPWLPPTTWASGIYYTAETPSSTVYHEDAVYVCIYSHYSGPEFQSGFWQVILTSGYAETATQASIDAQGYMVQAGEYALEANGYLEAVVSLASQAQAAIEEAVAAAGLAQGYAQTPEDTTVPGGSGYSALHYAAKAGADAAAADAARELAEVVVTNAQAAALTVATWTALAALTAAVAGTGAEVLDTDTGTHTDPVVGGTVSNAGRYSWSVSPAGWQRIGATGLSSKADIAAVAEVKRAVGLPVSATALTPASGSVTPSVFRAFLPTIGQAYTLRAVFHTSGIRYVQLYNSGAQIACNAIFDCQARTLTTAVGTGAWRDLGGGWVEVTVTTAAATAAVSQSMQMRLSQTGVWPYSANGSDLKIVSGFELFAVGSTINLFPASDPSNAAFSKSSISVGVATTPEMLIAPTVAANALGVAALDTIVNGAMTGWAFTEASGTISPTVYQVVAWVSGSTYVFDVIGKAAGRTRINLYCNVVCPFNCTFDLARGTASGTGASILHLGNGWYRCRVTVTSPASGNANAQIRIYPAVGGQPYAGDGVSGLFVQEAALYRDGGTNILQNPTNFAAWQQINVTRTSDQALYVGLRYAAATSAPALHPLTGKRLAFVGTSLVAQGILTSALALETGATIQQLGSSGGALGLDARGSPHYGSGAVTALFPSIDAAAEVVLLDMCVNDIAGSDVPLGSVTDTTTATYYGALANFFAWCEANRPNAAVCVVVPTAASPAYPVSDYRHGVPNANGATVEDFQNATRRAALYAGRPCIDPNAYGIGYLDMETGEATSDGLHWDASGAAKIAKIYHKQMVDFCEAGWLSLA